MKKLAFLALSATLLFTSSFAQGGDYARFHFSFIPPLSTNGFRAAHYTNGASVSLFAGLSGNEESLSLAGFANIVIKDIKGVQLAGMANYAGGDGSGFMAAGFANIIGNHYKGCQLAGFANYARSVSGVQLAGMANVSLGGTGTQLAGFFNVGGDVKGSQIAGFLNVAKSVSGVQLAGFVNIARESDYPIGILNIIGNGEKYLGVTYDALGSATLSFRSGSKVTYGILGVGYNFRVREIDYLFDAGLGANINILPWLRIRNELKSSSMNNFKEGTVAFTGGYFLMPCFRLGIVEIFGGPNINYLNSSDVTLDKLFVKNPIWEDRGTSKVHQVYLGYMVGVNFRLGR